jgi:hypothetical protein
LFSNPGYEQPGVLGGKDTQAREQSVDACPCAATTCISPFVKLISQRKTDVFSEPD